MLHESAFHLLMRMISLLPAWNKSEKRMGKEHENTDTGNQSALAETVKGRGCAGRIFVDYFDAGGTGRIQHAVCLFAPGGVPTDSAAADVDKRRAVVTENSQRI